MTMTSGLSSSATPISKKERHYTTHCLNPNPVYKRPQLWKGLPGAHGTLFRILSSINPAQSPLFQHAIAEGLRKRKLHPLRAKLLKPFLQSCLSRIDIPTSIVQVSLEDIASDLKVTDDRVYRLVDEVLIELGVLRMVVDYESPVDLASLSPEKRKVMKRFGLVWDEKHNKWFPKVLYATDLFFRVCGAGDKLLHDIHVQQEMRLDDMSLDLPELKGQFLSVGEARKIVRAQIFEKSWQKRLGATRLQREKAKIADLSTISARREYGAKMLRRHLGDAAVAAMTADQFDRAVWDLLNKFGLSVINSSSAAAPPH